MLGYFYQAIVKMKIYLSRRMGQQYASIGEMGQQYASIGVNNMHGSTICIYRRKQRRRSASQ